MSEKANLSMVRAINFSLIWDIFIREHEQTIPQLIEKTGLSLPTVTRAVEYGLDIGFLRQNTIGESTGGRKPKCYCVYPDYADILLIYYSSGRLYFRVADLLSQTIVENSMSTSLTAVLGDIERIVVEQVNKRRSITVAVISINGVIKDGTIVEWWANPQADNFDLKAHLESIAGITVVVENDMKTVTKACGRYVSRYKEKNIVCIQFGHNGFGAGICLEGKVLHGKSGFAGEIGYLPIAIKYEFSPNFCSKAIQSVIAAIEPDAIIVYVRDNKVNLTRVINNVRRHIPAYAMPEITEGKDFRTDIFSGMYLLADECEKSRIEEEIKKGN